MEGVRGGKPISYPYSDVDPPLHKLVVSRRTLINRLFALLYSSAILALLYYHSLKLINSTNSLNLFFVTFCFLISDIVLAFWWITTQSCRMCPVYRHEFPENLKRVLKETDYPALDVFICTADPYKEPPMSVVNTALSVMTYDYPTDKISIYISDDGGSALTLFAFMEAANFAKHWLPFCRNNNVAIRSPDVYFATINDHFSCSETQKIKILYESMKVRVGNVVERGEVREEDIKVEHDRQAFNKWSNPGFTRQDHPTVIQVILDKSKDKDITDHKMPSLIYVSREKSKTTHHHFKAGALNVLIRVSATMSNAPIILTLDCDMYSNDPQTPRRVLCYFSDPKLEKKIGYVQFPQRYRGINKNDIYAGEIKRLFIIHPVGMDGLLGPNYVGTGCFFSRRAFFGSPSTFVPPEIPELDPETVVNRPIQSPQVMDLAHHVAGCNYEKQTQWGYKMGVRYGSLVEDFYTGYRLQCEGWKTIFCNPKRAQFYGDAPISLVDVLNQNKRWNIGLLEVTLSKHCPLTFGTKAMGPLMGLAYAHWAFWPICTIPVTTYAFLPQLALLNGLTVFPKVSEPWFLLYVFLFVGSYGQDLVDFVVVGEGSVQRWWSDQRMWLIRGLSSNLFGFVEYVLKSFGISSFGFNLTSKFIDEEQSKRYEQGIFEFGIESPMFVPMTVAAIINMVAFFGGLVKVLRSKRSFEELFTQILIAGFAIGNCVPVYKAMFLRTNTGGISARTTIVSTVLAFVLFVAAYVTLSKHTI